MSDEIEKIAKLLGTSQADAPTPFKWTKVNYEARRAAEQFSGCDDTDTDGTNHHMSDEIEKIAKSLNRPIIETIKGIYIDGDARIDEFLKEIDRLYIDFNLHDPKFIAFWKKHYPDDDVTNAPDIIRRDSESSKANELANILSQEKVIGYDVEVRCPISGWLGRRFVKEKDLGTAIYLAIFSVLTGEDPEVNELEFEVVNLPGGGQAWRGEVENMPFFEFIENFPTNLNVKVDGRDISDWRDLALASLDVNYGISIK